MPTSLPAGAVRQLRLVVVAADFDAAVVFYRDVLGLPEQAAFTGDGDARVVILEAGRATLELANPAQRAMIDRVEVGRDVSGHVRVAFEVTDAAGATDALVAAGATLLAAPVETPWRSLNARLDGPAGLQLTVFEELETIEQRTRREGFGTTTPPPPSPTRAAAVLKVRSVADSVRWYEAAGFVVHGTDRTDAPRWAEVGRDGLVLQFVEGDTPWDGEPSFTGSFYAYPPSVVGVFGEIRDRVVCPWGVETRPWGAVELTLRDPDGYHVTFTGER